MIDRSRFELLYSETSSNVSCYVASMIGWNSQVEDITQEAYLRLLTSAPDRLLDGQLKSYLFTTATNIVRDLWRRGAVAGDWMPLDQEEANPTVCMDAAVDDKIDIAKALDSLSIMQRSLVWLAYAEGYTHREIATITGIREKSAKVLLFRARQKFIIKFRGDSAMLKRNS
jgi:RNA polymerase sigma-70 factor (ECF subfamily)